MQFWFVSGTIGIFGFVGLEILVLSVIFPVLLAVVVFTFWFCWDIWGKIGFPLPRIRISAVFRGSKIRANIAGFFGFSLFFWFFVQSRVFLADQFSLNSIGFQQ